jgi:hypothetical protein
VRRVVEAVVDLVPDRAVDLLRRETATASREDEPIGQDHVRLRCHAPESRTGRLADMAPRVRLSRFQPPQADHKANVNHLRVAWTWTLPPGANEATPP